MDYDRLPSCIDNSGHNYQPYTKTETRIDGGGIQITTSTQIAVCSKCGSIIDPFNR